MRFANWLALGLSGTTAVAAQLDILSLTGSGRLTLANAFTNGVCLLERADTVVGPWRPLKNLFTTSFAAETTVPLEGASGFYRASALDLSGGRPGFANLTRAYGMLTTIAGAGGPQANNWRPEFEGGPATAAVLSSPHIALADREGQVFIADKDSHGVRKIRVDGTIVTAAGVNAPGNGPDDLTPATQVALNQPNGLWVGSDGTVFILDLGNSKVRRLGRDGQLRTLFTVPDGILAGRGLWVSDDEQTAYVASNTAVKRWTPEQGVVNFATGFTSLGNLVVDPRGRVVVADRGGHRVYRLDSQGGRTVIAGTGGTTGGGDGQSAILTALNEVRGVWFLPTGAFFLATHRGSQVWYVDTDGLIHLFLQGLRGGMPAGNGTWFYAPSEPRVSECRAVTVDPEGNVLVTENDAGYVRKITFLPFR